MKINQVLNNPRSSFNKILRGYFQGVARKPYSLRGETILPSKLLVSPLICRGYTCPPNCSACCFQFDLLWCPEEALPYKMSKINFKLNGRLKFLFIDTQENQKGYFCKHVHPINGRCAIHGKHPFSCDFELTRFVHQSKIFQNRLLTTSFGRGWNMTRTTGEKGALCKLTKPTSKSISDTVRKLKRLKVWTDYFEVVTHLDEIIQWVEKGPHSKPLRLEPDHD